MGNYLSLFFDQAFQIKLTVCQCADQSCTIKIQSQEERIYINLVTCLKQICLHEKYHLKQVHKLERMYLNKLSLTSHLCFTLDIFYRLETLSSHLVQSCIRSTTPTTCTYGHSMLKAENHLFKSLLKR